MQNVKGVRSLQHPKTLPDMLNRSKLLCGYIGDASNSISALSVVFGSALAVYINDFQFESEE